MGAVLSERVETDRRSTLPEAAVELTVVVPTYNERDNIEPLIEKLEAALEGVAWEVVFVDDDSRDGTADRVREVAARNARVRILQRIGRRGLSTACIEGILSSAAPFAAVIDADLQHDERLLPKMLASLKTEPLDIVVGSRYVEGGGVGDWNSARVAISGFAGRLSKLIVKADLNDPMSGFFMLRRAAFDGAVRKLSGQGFKILLDIFASAPSTLRFKELPYQFGLRLRGESKLDTMVAWEYAMLILDKLFGHILPVRFVLFALVGGLGVGVNLVALWLGLNVARLDFTLSQTIATIVAMAGNYSLNNFFTYRDQRLRGLRFLLGFLSFALVCSVGTVSNVGIASYLFKSAQPWWLAGIAGALVGAVWNYAVTSIFTWKVKPV